MKKILLLTVGVLLVIGLIGVGTFSTLQKVGAGTGEPGPEFMFSDLVISPTEAGIGQIVTISVAVTNIEDYGTAEVTLKINGVVEETKEVTLGRFESTDLTFTVSKDVAGTYSVAVDSLTGLFIVKEESDAIPFPVIGGIIAAVVVVGLLVFFLIRRKAI